MSRSLKRSNQKVFQLARKYALTVILLFIIAILSLEVISENESYSVSRPENIVYDPVTKTLDLSSLTLQQKIAQMIVVYGKDGNEEVFQNMLIGGVYFDAKNTSQDFKQAINSYQNEALVPFLVTLDLEGCINPLENFLSLPKNSEISTSEEAYFAGVKAGRIMNELGFTMNFAPVIDLEDNILHCRSFHGTPAEISQKAQAYVHGLQQQGVLAVAKHYPGKTLAAADPHTQLSYAMVSSEDLLPFEELMTSDVTGLMIAHTIVTGAVNSDARPASISTVVGEAKQEFSGLIVSDETGMLGLTSYYPPEVNRNLLFADLVAAGNDFILYFDRNPLHIQWAIEAVEQGVLNGQISEEQIDNSVRKILTAKGIKVVG